MIGIQNCTGRDSADIHPRRGEITTDHVDVGLAAVYLIGKEEISWLPMRRNLGRNRAAVTTVRKRSGAIALENGCDRVEIAVRSGVRGPYGTTSGTIPSGYEPNTSDLTDEHLTEKVILNMWRDIYPEN